MLQFVVDQGDPLGALEECGMQLDFLVDVLSQGGAGGVEFGDVGAAGFANLLRAISGAVNTVGNVIRRAHPVGLAIIEREPAPAEETVPSNRSERRALIARLLAEETDASNTIAGGADTLPAAPRLTEPRASARQRRAA